jgi:hypothetical protein
VPTGAEIFGNILNPKSQPQAPVQNNSNEDEPEDNAQSDAQFDSPADTQRNMKPPMSANDPRIKNRPRFDSDKQNNAEVFGNKPAPPSGRTDKEPLSRGEKAKLPGEKTLYPGAKKNQAIRDRAEEFAGAPRPADAVRPKEKGKASDAAGKKAYPEGPNQIRYAGSAAKQAEDKQKREERAKKAKEKIKKAEEEIKVAAQELKKAQQAQKDAEKAKKEAEADLKVIKAPDETSSVESALERNKAEQEKSEPKKDPPQRPKKSESKDKPETKSEPKKEPTISSDTIDQLESGRKKKIPTGVRSNLKNQIKNKFKNQE